MGTSMSSKGPKGTNALVPPWAEQGNGLEISGQESLEIDNQIVQDLIGGRIEILPSSSRFISARRAFGKYAKNTGTSDDLKRALRNYSHAIGGSTGANKRLASGITAGTGLFGLLTGDTVHNSESSLNLRDLSGLSTDLAIDRISEHLSPNSADADHVRTAINYALSEALEDYSDFDDVHVTPELLGQVFTCYLTDLVFEQVVLDMGEEWLYAETINKQIQMENELRELIKIIVDNNLDNVSNGNLSLINKNNIAKIQIDAITEVIKEWENF